jgi:holin-like protein
MLEAIFAIFICQLLGEAITRGLGIPIPGPVLGMLMLFLALQLRGLLKPLAAPANTLPIGIVSAFLIGHLSLLFVPAGTGIISHLPTLTSHGIGLFVVLVVSTALSLAATALVFSYVAGRVDGSKSQPSPGDL